MILVNRNVTAPAVEGYLRPEEIDLKEYLEQHWVEIGIAIEGPQAAAANGRLPASALMNIPGGRLERAAALRWLAMRDYIGNKHGVWISPLGGDSSYRSYDRQVYYWNLYVSGRGNVAARPGTSNHGWGRAVDVATQVMAYYIRKYGHLFGWSHAEGARVGEWWHFTYVGGGRINTGPTTAQKKARMKVWMPGRDYTDQTTKDFQRIHGLSVDGKIGPKTWKQLKKSRELSRDEQIVRNRMALAKNKADRKKYKNQLVAMRKDIWRSAEGKKKGVPSGWGIRNRRVRYHRLSKLT